MGLNFTPKPINNFKEVNLSGLSFPSIAIYKNTKDYPKEHVARVWSSGRPTDIIMVRNTLRELIAEVKREYPDAYFIPSCESIRPCDPDNEKIVGTYIL